MKIFTALIFTLLVVFNLSAQISDFSPVTQDDVALVVYDITEGKNVVSLNGDKPFSFASNLKLLTTAAALENLGGGFRFFTFFSFDPADGTLYIKATGDPEMVVEQLWQLALELKLKGIKGIKKVVVDDFLYGNSIIHSAVSGDKGDNAYLAYISPFSLNYNAITIYVKAHEAGKPVEVTLSTPSSHFVIKNSATGIAGGDNRLIVGTTAGKNSKTEILVKGSLGVARSKPETIFKRVGHPTNYYVSTLLNLMGEKEDLPISREKIDQQLFSKKENINHTWKSSPLREILRKMNLYSSNFIADSLQFFMGAIIRGNSAQGVEILKEYAQNKLGETIDIVNGSGLGNGQNQLTAEFFIKLLKNVYSDYYSSIDFFASLPVLGEDGTLKKAQTGESTGFVRAKTGSLTGVASLSGIMKAKSGKLYFFSFSVNNFPAKKFQPMWDFRDKVINEIWEKY